MFDHIGREQENLTLCLNWLLAFYRQHRGKSSWDDRIARLNGSLALQSNQLKWTALGPDCEYPYLGRLST